MTGGRPPNPVEDDVVVPVSAPLAEVGDVLGDADACAVAGWRGRGRAAAGAAVRATDACEPAAERTVVAARGRCPRPTTISGALARVATLVPPTSEPTITPNPSIPITAAAAARGPGIANCGPRGAGGGSRMESASGVPGAAPGLVPARG